MIAAVVLLLAFDLAFLFQRFAGAHRSDFGGTPKEAAQVLHGMMVRDYLKSGLGKSPRGFASEYQAHFPAAVDGPSAPAVSLLLGLWQLVSGATRVGTFLFMAAIGAAGATLIYLLAEKSVSPWIAGASALLWISHPVVRDAYCAVSPELVACVFLLAAVLGISTWLRGRASGAVLFGIFGGLAILSGASVVAVAAVILLPVLLVRDMSLLKRRSLWSGLIIAAVIAASMFIWKGSHPGTKTHASADGTLGSGTLLFDSLAPTLLVVIFAALGIIAGVIRRERRSEVWKIAVALVLAGICDSVLAGHSFGPHRLAVVMAGLVCFTAIGIALASEWVQSRIGREQDRRHAPAVVSMVVLLLALACSTRITPKGFSGLGSPAAELAGLSGPGEKILVSSDSTGEATFVTELALRDKSRPSLTVKKAGDVFGDGRVGGRSEAELRSEDDVIDTLRKQRIRYVVLDDAFPEEERNSRHDLLKQAILQRPDGFFEVSHWEAYRNGQPLSSPVRVYRFAGNVDEN